MCYIHSLHWRINIPPNCALNATRLYVIKGHKICNAVSVHITIFLTRTFLDRLMNICTKFHSVIPKTTLNGTIIKNHYRFFLS